ncbi:hypothetical protein [Streptomyces longispororuber]|uniref:hypothetical protein n=1 Tax=Streptomyces longispororuber TaxID=68230 RepID=UPI003701B7B8
MTAGPATVTPRPATAADGPAVAEVRLRAYDAARASATASSRSPRSAARVV